MLKKLRHRGPDDEGIVQMGSAILGHRRLSIIDLNTGSQPMFNEDGTVAVILNGEIYNFRELRCELEKKGHSFRSSSDTEAIVHLYEEVGEAVFSKLNGMFAAVIYDSKTNTLLAGRDPIGEKPLLYWDSGEAVFIVSEIKALLEEPTFRRTIDLEALALYLNCMYVPAPKTIFEGVRKLPPGHYLKVSAGSVDVRQYWTPEVAIDWDLDERAVVQEFRRLFGETVRMRTVSDVPVGVFLSGGIDSSAVTAFMAMGLDRPVRTFSVGFSDEIDERPYARLVAEQFRTQHTEILVEDRIEDVFQRVIEHFDEPFGDSSAIPTYLVSREARKHVKVILTGDGGDELFAGYESYLDQKNQLSSKNGTRLYRAARTLLGSLVNRPWFESLYPREVGEYAYDHWMWVRTIFPRQEIDELLGRSSIDVRRFFPSHRWLRFTGRDSLSLAFEHDLNYYLPDDLLKKVDMAAMMSGLECRAPFLDHRLIEFSMKIPPNRKLGNGQTKYLLRKSLEGILPDAILRRGKIGFGAPVTSWLRNQLREITGDLLAPGSRTEGLIPRSAIDRVLAGFYKGPSSSDFRVAYRLWLLLVLEVWARRYA